MSITEQAEDAAPPPILATVGALVQAARAHALMTQAVLAEELGVTQTAVSCWEAGKRDMGVGGLLRIAEACGVPASSLLPEEHREPSGTDGTGGYFAEIAFMGHNEHTGYVTETVKNGQPAYRVDLPEKLWGGNPLAYVEYSASAWFSERPMTGASIRSQWEAGVRAAAERARREAEWRRVDEQRALTAGREDDGETCGCGDPDCDGCEGSPD
jgi:transcriptional regulator with XRE-family HTH domain